MGRVIRRRGIQEWEQASLRQALFHLPSAVPSPMPFPRLLSAEEVEAAGDPGEAGPPEAAEEVEEEAVGKGLAMSICDPN